MRDRSAHENVRGRLAAVEPREKTRRALAEARQALSEARDEVRQALDEARDEVHHAFDEVRVAFVSDDIPAPPVLGRPAHSAATEDADEIPVPIVPGTRVTNAEATAPAQRTAESAVAAVGSPSSQRRTVTGRLSATKERAVADARSKLRSDLTNWLDPDVPRTWTPPARTFDAMVVGEPEIKKIEKDYGELFEATLTVDTSSRASYGSDRALYPRVGRAANGRSRRNARLHLDMPGGRFRLHSRRRSDQGLLHQSAENAGRRGSRCLRRDHLPHGGVSAGTHFGRFRSVASARQIGRLLGDTRLDGPRWRG